MDLRDQFAAAVLPVLVNISGGHNASGQAKLAYQFADAAMEARGRELMTARPPRYEELQGEVARLRVAVDALRVALGAKVATESHDGGTVLARLRACVEWYADDANWEAGFQSTCAAHVDAGDIARRILREVTP